MNPQSCIWYRVNGFIIASELPLPVSLRAAMGSDEPDIFIAIDPFLKNGVDTGSFSMEPEPQQTTICLPEAGVLRIVRGSRIVVSPYAGADEERLQNYILYYGMDEILRQRGDLSWSDSRLSLISAAMTAT
ncbi:MULTISPECIES: hypothetical protein [unclassified Paenibacillus]|uniref:hypothetical protein n=1 Tax=unclassified Paenibacillus TaxID=185978 RepID=UPI0036D3B90A